MEVDQMYKISEFSKITNLTVKALRYYDEERILTPSYRDESNSYRYYNDNDFRKAEFIVLLKSLDFSISEIKEILTNCESETDLSYYLEEKKNQILGNIAKENSLIKKIGLHIKSKKLEESNMDYQIEVKVFDPVTVASIRFKGKYRDVGKYIGTIYKVVKNNAAGAPFNLYYDAEYKEEADIEICVPTKKIIQDTRITAKRLDAIKAISTTHKGSYDSLNLAYKALLDYANKNNLTCKTPSREVYIKGPGMIFRGNENSYITEIIIPFEEA
jgi:DNA-binding transcriptional MerR regulator